MIFVICFLGGPLDGWEPLSLVPFTRFHEGDGHIYEAAQLDPDYCAEWISNCCKKITLNYVGKRTSIV